MSTLSVVAAFLRRDFLINISYRTPFVAQGVASVLQLALFFYLSQVVDEADFASQGLSGGYFAYAAVGLALITVVQISLSSFSTKLREEQVTGTFEVLMATPTSPSLIVLSSAVYDLIRATVSAVVLIGAAVAIFGLHLDLDPGSIGVAVLALAGCLVLFATLGVTIAAFTVIFKRGTAILGIMFTGLGLLAGVYFPIELLPDPLQQIGSALPFTWGLEVFRASLLGGDVDAAQLAGLYASAMLLLPLALLAFTASVRRVRRTGTLGEY
ncbi:MAG: ABC transporter permease [Solirubrobacterales bacterium]